jgi:thiosulfate dehydrogenase (quinone) large subunit
VSTLRRMAVPIGVVAAVLLFLLFNPWFPVEGDIRTVMTWAFWISFIVLLIALFEDRNAPEADEIEIQGPRFVRFLFFNSRAGLFWLPIRLFVGFSWLEAGYHKLTDPGWTQGGTALMEYWERVVAIPEEGRPPISYEWYRDFIQMLLDNGAYSWFAWVITLGELAVGIGLLVGALTGIAAFFGATMNMSFMLAGSASTNPILFTLAVGLMLAWRVAGYYGLDRYLLPALGAPWRPGTAFRREEPPPAPAGSSPG